MTERDSAPFDAKTVAWLIVASTLAFVGFLFFTAYAPAIKSKSADGFAPLSRSAIGYAGLMQLIDGVTGEPVAVLADNESLNEPGLVLMPLAPESDMAAIVDFARARAHNVPGGTTLFVLPKWQTRPLGWGGDRVQRLQPIDPATLASFTRPLSGAAPVYWQPPSGTRLSGVGNQRPALPVRPLSVQVAGSRLIKPLLALDADHIVLGRLSGIAGGAVYLLADPDLIANHGLRTLEGAALALAIVRAVQPDGDQRVSIDPEPARGRPAPRNLLQLMFEPPFLAVSIAVLAAAALAGLHAFGRFGPALPEVRALPFGKQALVDNTARLLARAGAVKRLGERYVVLTRDAVAAALGAPVATVDGRDASLNRLTPADQRKFSALANAARGARTDDALRAAAAALHQWKDEVTRDRR